jgi:hypothetical protein
MIRITITVPPAVSQLLKDKTNRSHYISDLILRDAYDAHKDELMERTKKALLKDEIFIRQLHNGIQTVGYNYTKLIEDVSPPEETA